MKKIVVIVLAALALLVAGYFIFKKESPTTLTETNMGAPTRPAEITGLIVSQLGNEIVVAKEVGKVVLSEEEQAAKKAEMQKLSPEQRMAIREEENLTTETEDVKLVIPVGTIIVKGTGEANGNITRADIAELTKGTYIAVWLDQNDNIEYVKIKQI